MLRLMGSQRVGHDFVVEQQHLYQRERIFIKVHISSGKKNTTTGYQAPAHHAACNGVSALIPHILLSWHFASYI